MKKESHNEIKMFMLEKLVLQDYLLIKIDKCIYFLVYEAINKGLFVDKIFYSKCKW